MRFRIEDIYICSDNERKTKAKNLSFLIDSGKYIRSKKAIIKTLLAQKPPGMEPLKKFDALIVFRTRKDPTNLIKILLDSMQKAQIIENDKKWGEINLRNHGSGKDCVIIDIKQNYGILFEGEEDVSRNHTLLSQER